MCVPKIIFLLSIQLVMSSHLVKFHGMMCNISMSLSDSHKFCEVFNIFPLWTLKTAQSQVFLHLFILSRWGTVFFKFLVVFEFIILFHSWVIIFLCLSFVWHYSKLKFFIVPGSKSYQNFICETVRLMLFKLTLPGEIKVYICSSFINQTGTETQLPVVIFKHRGIRTRAFVAPSGTPNHSAPYILSLHIIVFNFKKRLPFK